MTLKLQENKKKKKNGFRQKYNVGTHFFIYYNHHSRYGNVNEMFSAESFTLKSFLQMILKNWSDTIGARTSKRPHLIEFISIAGNSSQTFETNPFTMARKT